MNQDDAKDAASDAVDLDRLLDGEDPNTSYPDDVDHWRRVYRELLDYKSEMLARTRDRVAGMDPRAAEEIEKTDLTVLVAETERFQRRLAYWEQRASSGPSGDAPSS